MNNRSFDFSLLYKTKFPTLDKLATERTYDVFISAYNDSERVQQVFDRLNATDKYWLILPQYGYTPIELASVNGPKIEFNSKSSESELIRSFFEDIGVTNFANKSICIDMTGFVRPHLLFLVRYLAIKFPKSTVDFIYTDPIKYADKENTKFSQQYNSVRQVDGFQGSHDPDTSNDCLIIGSGYDYLRINDVSKSKASARKIQLFGFPSLQPDMFQENILKAYMSEEATSNENESFIDSYSTIFAPANDPFVTANVIKERVRLENKRQKLTNLYLSPLSTKAQTLGMALYYISNCVNTNTSMIFPFCDQYSRETTHGISRIWRYTVDFKAITGSS